MIPEHLCVTVEGRTSGAGNSGWRCIMGDSLEEMLFILLAFGKTQENILEQNKLTAPLGRL